MKVLLIFVMAALMGCTLAPIPDDVEEPPRVDTVLENPIKIDREGIRKVFFNRATDIKLCYEKFLEDVKDQKEYKGKKEGIIKFDFDIGKEGKVLYSQINKEQSSFKNTEVAGCIQKKMFSWTFPEPPKKQVVNVIYPIAFGSK